MLIISLTAHERALPLQCDLITIKVGGMIDSSVDIFNLHAILLGSFVLFNLLPNSFFALDLIVG